MNDFERITYTDPSREIPIERERCRIEMSDEEYIDRVLKHKNKLALESLEKNEIAVDSRKKDEKSKSEKTVKATKKVSTKSDKTAVANIQKEL